MGTWMIHFLCPELKSQHLGKVEASVPSPSYTHSPPAHKGLRVGCSGINCQGHRTGVLHVARPEATFTGLFGSNLL